MQLVLGHEPTKELVWEKSTSIYAAVGAINYHVIDTTGTNSHAFSYQHRLESEAFEDPAQLHMESDLVEELRKQKLR